MSKILNGREFLAQMFDDSVTPEDFEMRFGDGDESDWVGVRGSLTLRRVLEDPVVFRWKPKTRVINGFTVPAPLSSMKNGDKYYVASVTSMEWSIQFPLEYCGDENDTIWLSRGLCFATLEAAIANAKAMCGINPEE